MILVMPRPSPVSDAVRDVFHGHARHAWSIDQLHEAVRGELGAADYSSVFRAVTTMEREGAIRRIDLGDGKAYYEVGEDHHECREHRQHDAADAKHAAPCDRWSCCSHPLAPNGPAPLTPSFP